MYKCFQVPVFPIFLAEMEEINRFSLFDFAHTFPDTPHQRRKSAQRSIDSLRQQLPQEETLFIDSIKQTMAEIFMLQGAFMNKRVEEEGETKAVVARIINLLHKAPSVASHQLPSPSLPPITLSNERKSPNISPLSSVAPNREIKTDTQTPHSHASSVVVRIPPQITTPPLLSSSPSPPNPSPTSFSSPSHSIILAISVAVAVSIAAVWSYSRQRKR